MLELYLRNFAFTARPESVMPTGWGDGGPPAGVNQGHGTSKNGRTKTKQRRRKRRKTALKSKRMNRR